MHLYFFLIREQDYEGYLCSLFYPRPELAWTLRALNLHLAQVRDHASNDTMAEMRLVWWRDALDAVFNGEPAPKGHPEFEALQSLLLASNGGRSLSHAWFRKLLQARVSFDFPPKME